MRILLATYWHLPHIGGVSTYVDTLRNGLEQMGHEVEILAQHPDLAHYYLIKSGRQVEKHALLPQTEAAVCDGYRKRGMELTPWIVGRETEKYVFASACRQLGVDGYDLIHTQDIFSTFVCSRVKPDHIPLVATIHGFLATEWIANGEIRMRAPIEQDYLVLDEYFGATSPDCLILPSRWLAGRLAALQIAHPRTHIIPYGLDLQAIAVRAQDTGDVPAEPGRKVIACPARLVAIKGQTYLLQALAFLLQTHTDIVCWLIGDGVMRQDLEQQAERLGISEHVRFLGDRSDVPALLNAADLVVLPSLQDNLPFVVMEAQTLGKPVLASNVGGIGEMIADGKTGMLVKPGDSWQLSEKILQLLTDDGLRQRLSQGAKSSAWANWHARTMLERTVEVYQAAVTGRVAASTAGRSTKRMQIPDPAFVTEFRRRRRCSDGDSRVPIAPTASLHGRVSWGRERLPIPGVSVHLLDVSGVVVSSVRTGRLGEYTIPAVPMGNYALICAAGTFGMHMRKIAVTAAGRLSIDFALANEGHTAPDDNK
ncbi:glycosyltransferase [Effusibacillus pohliae]|uniref:glycosyltransferase n=1 Tax=Effusibacillus pohliae TaxID=232270 RepID=UPI00036E65AE|nr:glycosyltransferase [Effusibacillus pohliae]